MGRSEADEAVERTDESAQFERLELERDVAWQTWMTLLVSCLRGGSEEGGDRLG